MPSANYCILQGRLGGDPRFGISSNDKQYAVFTIAYQPTTKFHATWVPVFAYKKSAEIVESLELRKGDLVTVVGDIFTVETKKKSGCPSPHLGIRALYVYLLVKSKRSESEHYEDVRQPRTDSDEPPFA